MRFRILFFAWLVFAVMTPARGETIFSELRAGVAAQSCCGWAQSKEQGVAINGEALFRSPRFLSVLGSPRPVVGGAVATDSDATSYGYVGLAWNIDLTEVFFVGGALGGAVHNGETDAYDPAVDEDRFTNTHFFGCRVLFRTSADAGVRLTERVSAMVTWSHISNAGICGDNEGLDQLGLRLGFSL